MTLKRLIVAVEGTAAMGPYWKTIVSDYLDKIVRCFCEDEPMGKKTATSEVELSLVMFSTHGPYSGCLVQRTGWTKDMDLFLQSLSTVRFAGGGFNDAAIAEGLAEALIMLSPPNGIQDPNMEGKRHCILVAASNPYPLPTPVYRPQPLNPEPSENIETKPDTRLFDVETLAKSFAECAISLSVICPKQLAKLRSIYNAGKRNPEAVDPPVDKVKNPHFLVLISENLFESHAALSHCGLMNLSSNQNHPEMDVASVSPISGPPPTSIPSGLGMNQNTGSRHGIHSGTSMMVPTPGISQQPGMQPVGMSSNDTVTNMSLSQSSPNSMHSVSVKNIKVWEGNLSGQRQGQPVFITRLEGFRRSTSPKTIAADWPSTMQIVRIISQDYMNKKPNDGHLVIFRALNQHGFLEQLHERKLCAVIQLTSQRLLIQVSEAARLVGRLYSGDMVVSTSRVNKCNSNNP